MKRWITTDDFTDLFVKMRQRGGRFFLSKINPNPLQRTKSAFDDTAIHSANWWIVPAVQHRWNKMISGDTTVNYKQKLMRDYLAEKNNLRLLSLGSGTCSHELELASYRQFETIHCWDIAQNRLDIAKAKANSLAINNIHFICGDINRESLGDEAWDIILFNASLHHFFQIRKLLENKIKTALKPGGLVVINEYVGPDRLQYPPEQIRAINRALKQIDHSHRERFKTKLIKNHYSGSGWLRMILADPSECVNSSAILPSLHFLFDVVVEKPYGGNLLMPVLKDIAHHFLEDDKKSHEILSMLFDLEDEYLKNYPSDFVFGIYQKPIPGAKVFD